MLKQQRTAIKETDSASRENWCRGHLQGQENSFVRASGKQCTAPVCEFTALPPCIMALPHKGDKQKKFNATSFQQLKIDWKSLENDLSDKVMVPGISN